MESGRGIGAGAAVGAQFGLFTTEDVTGALWSGWLGHRQGVKVDAGRCMGLVLGCGRLSPDQHRVRARDGFLVLLFITILFQSN